MRGFTLVETVIYIALLALIMGGSLMAAYQITQSSGALAQHDATGIEADFILRKIEWGLGGAESIIIPNATTSQAPLLSVRRHDGTTVVIRQNSALDTIEMSEGGAYLPLTTHEIKGPQLVATYILGPGKSSGVHILLTLNGKTFTLKKYLFQ